MINYNTRQIPWAPDYFVTECGKVFSYKSGFMKERKLTKRSGYPYLPLALETGSKKFLVHRLVAELFLPNPNAHTIVNHIDGSRDNNHFSNLEWCTQSHNIKHALDAGKRAPLGSRHRSAKLHENDIPVIRKILEMGLSCAQVAKVYSVDTKTINTIRSGKTWGYVK